MPLTSTELQTLELLAKTFLPAVDGDSAAWTESGAGPGFSDRVERIVDQLPHDQDRKDLALFLRLFRSRLGGAILYRMPRPLTDLSPHEREQALLSIQTNPSKQIRAGIRAVKALIAFLWVSTESATDEPASWEAIGYPGPLKPAPDVEKTITPIQITGDTSLTADVVVVGSGAGGGVAAGVLASAGHDVIVLEAGEYSDASDFTHLEADAYRRMYLDGALSSTADGGITILAGATLGGGTVINYTTSFPTPDRVRAEWDAVAGFDGVFAGERYSQSAAAVEERFSVNRDNGQPSSRAQLLEKGLRDLGWHVDEMPRNVDGCTEDECGYCTMGCRIGAKQSTLLTYLQDAFDAGARIVTGAKVDKVLADRGRAKGVVASVGSHRLTVNANTVILAAGGLHTPAILLRSGLGGPAVGKYLRLHPVTAVWARFEERIEPWTGFVQTRYSDQFADLDGDGYGLKFETAPVHPLFPAGFIGWENGPSFKRDILGLAHLSVAGVLLRDRDHGSVSIRRDGSPVWKYSISKYDQAHVRQGVRGAAEMFAAAGATELISSTIHPVRWERGDDLSEFARGVDHIGYGSNEMSYFSFHQMGSARMGSDPTTSVVDADNQSHWCIGLYVMDASCFPTSSGVNPMLSIATIAHRGATLLAERI